MSDKEPCNCLKCRDERMAKLDRKYGKPPCHCTACQIRRGEITPTDDRGYDSRGSACFLSSACLQARGLPDDCAELHLLRVFRDEFLRTRPGGEELIAEYYHIAPAIVLAIDKNGSDEEWVELFHSLVQPCVRLIRGNQNDAALRHYVGVVEGLKQKYNVRQVVP